MRRNHNISEKRLLSTGLALSLSALSGAASAGDFKVLHTFKRADGTTSFAGLYEDAAGDLFGTTLDGGTGGAGTAFELTPDSQGKGYAYTVIFPFTNGPDGGYPDANFIADSSGNLYSTTSAGGTGGAGNVFELSMANGQWTETPLYSFTGGADGGSPYSALIADQSGNFYGTTYDGGANGYGTVFELSLANGQWTETVLHPFAGGNDGAYPIARLMLYKGKLYGTTANGGSGTACDVNCGTVFSLDLSPPYKETVLYSFTGGSDGDFPEGGLVVNNGYIYSTAYGGGNSGCYPGYNCGTVWRMKPDGTSFSVIHSFTGGSDGGNPDNGLLVGAKGIMYGISERGGDPGCYAHAGCGAAFSLTTAGALTPLYDFTGGRDGGNVLGEMIEDKGFILDVAAEGGSKGCYEQLGCGTVFKVKE